MSAARKSGSPPPSPILLDRNLTDIFEHLLYLNCTSLHFQCHCDSLYISTNQHFTPLYPTVRHCTVYRLRLNTTERHCTWH